MLAESMARNTDIHPVVLRKVGCPRRTQAQPRMSKDNEQETSANECSQAIGSRFSRTSSVAAGSATPYGYEGSRRHREMSNREAAERFQVDDSAFHGGQGRAISGWSMPLALC